MQSCSFSFINTYNIHKCLYALLELKSYELRLFLKQHLKSSKQTYFGHFVFKDISLSSSSPFSKPTTLKESGHFRTDVHSTLN